MTPVWGYVTFSYSVLQVTTFIFHSRLGKAEEIQVVDTTWDDLMLGDKCQADVASSTPKHAEVLNSVGGAHHLQVVLLRASKPTK